MSKRILVVAGTRPNFMKAAPVLRAFEERSDMFETIFVHTGQHYDTAMSETFFTDLGMRKPNVRLELKQKTHSGKIAEIINKFSISLEEYQPHLVVVFGDVNSTIATALMALKHRIKIAHVEAGLRSFDRRMPEELNRILTDHISDFLFTSEESANKHLQSEGCDADKIVFVGNVMIDSLVALLPTIEKRSAQLTFESEKPLITVTLHRQENVDDRRILTLLLEQLATLTEDYHVYWPLHPRTKAMVNQFGLRDKLRDIEVVEPLGYIDFIATIMRSFAVVTDSGGIQEETTYLGVPCYTLRDSTERPVTVKIGTNTLIPPENLQEQNLFDRMQQQPSATHAIPDLWDGRSAERIISFLAEQL